MLPGSLKQRTTDDPPKGSVTMGTRVRQGSIQGDFREASTSYLHKGGGGVGPGRGDDTY